MLTALGFAFLATLLATPVVRCSAWRLGLLDRPNVRSSHQKLTPRSGGIAILVGLGAGFLALPRYGRDDVGAFIAAAMLLFLIGLADDRFGVPPWPRLAVQMLAAGIIVTATGGLERLPLPAPCDVPLGALGPFVAAFWVVTVVNFYNFMDGIDGLASLQALITAGAVALAFVGGGHLAAGIAASLVGACTAFLVYNWAPASVFLGDAGSGLVGFVVASLPLLAPAGRRSEAVVLVGASLFLFLADPALCFLRRGLRGARWFDAHREHLYQRWVIEGMSHGRVALSLGGSALVLTCIALLGWSTGRSFWYWTALGAGAVTTAAQWVLLQRLERRA